MRQHNEQHVSSLNFSLDNDAIRTGDIAALVDPFERLLRSLPQDVSVYCILDGIAWYENDYHNFTQSAILAGRLSELAWPENKHGDKITTSMEGNACVAASNSC